MSTTRRGFMAGGIGLAVAMGLPYARAAVPPRTTWKPTVPGQAPAQGDFPSLAANNVGLLDPAILQTRTNFTPQAGTTYTNLDIRNGFDWPPGAIFRNCRITEPSGFLAVMDSSNGTGKMFDCELVGPAGGNCVIDLNSGTLNRCYLHGSEDGSKVGGGTMRDCLVINNVGGAGGEHYDALQSMDGDGILIQHCYLAIPHVSGGTSAFIIKSDLGTINDVKVRYCYLEGHSWTIDVDNGGHGFPSKVRVNYNRFGRAVYGAITTHGGGQIVATKNVWDDTGQPITF